MIHRPVSHSVVVPLSLAPWPTRCRFFGCTAMPPHTDRVPAESATVLSFCQWLLLQSKSSKEENKQQKKQKPNPQRRFSLAYLSVLKFGCQAARQKWFCSSHGVGGVSEGDIVLGRHAHTHAATRRQAGGHLSLAHRRPSHLCPAQRVDFHLLMSATCTQRRHVTLQPGPWYCPLFVTVCLSCFVFP